MKLEQSFEVEAPIERVWEALIDVERVAPCLPGAEISDAEEGGVYRGSFTVKVGPTTAAYRGELQMDELDSSTRTAVMRASGQDKQGQGSAKATIVSRLREQDGSTVVDVETDLTITGRLARFGRGGMMEDISKRLMGDFASCLQADLERGEMEAAAEAAGAGAGEGAPGAEAGPPAESPAERRPTKPIHGLSLFFGVLWQRIVRLFRRLFKRGS